MKKIIVYILFISVVFSLMGCNGNTATETDEIESTVEYVVEMKEVIFLNRLEEIFYTDVIPTTNEIHYLKYEQSNPDALYAFCVGEYYYVSGERKNIAMTVGNMRGLGLMILEDYPYCHFNNDLVSDGNSKDKMNQGYCVVVGTIAELSELFAETEYILGAPILYNLTPAPRPDILDFIRASGWTEASEESPEVWYERNSKVIENSLGEEYQVTLTVPVIMPEETK